MRNIIGHFPEHKIVSSIQYPVSSIQYIVKMVSQFTGYPVEELKLGELALLTISHLATENLYLKLTTRINWPTGKPGNQVTE